MSENKSDEKRRHSRVLFSRTARVHIGEESYEERPIRNLSLGGMLLEGNFSVDPGETLNIELQEQGKHSVLVLHMCAKVVRRDDDCMAVAFTGMEPDSYMFLQTMVLYSTDDPFGVAMEFLDDFSENSSTPC